MGRSRTTIGNGIITPDIGKNTQFGTERGNANRCANPAFATSQREFYKWCENVATAEELEAYLNDETKPAIRRRFVGAMLNCSNVSDFFSLTNQTHGLPKQAIEVENAPTTLVIKKS